MRHILFLAMLFGSVVSGCSSVPPPGQVEDLKSLDPVAENLRKRAGSPAGFAIVVKERIGEHPGRQNVAVWFVRYKVKNDELHEPVWVIVDGDKMKFLDGADLKAMFSSSVWDHLPPAPGKKLPDPTPEELQIKAHWRALYDKGIALVK